MSKTGLITQEKLKEIARSVLNLLERENIDSIGSLFSRLGESFDIKGKDHIIQIELRPSKSGTEAYTISYINPKGGIPIEIRMNSDFNYSKIIVKTKSKLKKYKSFISDYFGNLIQDKTIRRCSISKVKKELEKLAS